jgi:hypothetical protein
LPAHGSGILFEDEIQRPSSPVNLSAFSLEAIPNEIQEYIFSFLPEQSLIALLRVNHSTKAVTENYIKERYAYRHFKIQNKNEKSTFIPLSNHKSYKAMKIAYGKARQLKENNPEVSQTTLEKFVQHRAGISFHGEVIHGELLCLRLKYIKFVRIHHLEIKEDSELFNSWLKEEKFRLKLVNSRNLERSKLLAKLFTRLGKPEEALELLCQFKPEDHPEIQYYRYKIEENSGIKHYQPLERYKILKAMVQNKSELQAQKKVKHKAEFHLARILHLIQSNINQDVFNDPFEFETNNSSFIIFSPPDSIIDLKKTWKIQNNIKYVKNSIASLSRDGSITYDGGLILDQHITLGSPTFGSSSSLTINTWFLKITGSITINYGSILTLNAAFVSINGLISGGGRLKLNGEDVEYNYRLRKYSDESSLRENFDPLEWYEKSAKGGYKNAQFLFGLMYMHGNGVIKDETEAVRWYTKAAKQGHINAQYNLGLMYANGQGVIQNKVEAVFWFKKAAQQGHSLAQKALLSPLLYK